MRIPMFNPSRVALLMRPCLFDFYLHHRRRGPMAAESSEECPDVACDVSWLRSRWLVESVMSVGFVSTAATIISGDEVK